KLGSEIPYLFHDIHAFADLFYCPDGRRFVAVTLYHNEQDMTTARIFSLNSPPLPSTTASVTGPAYRTFYYIGGILLFAIGLYFFVYVGKKKKNRTTATKAAIVSSAPTISAPSSNFSIANNERPKS